MFGSFLVIRCEVIPFFQIVCAYLFPCYVPVSSFLLDYPQVLPFVFGVYLVVVILWQRQIQDDVKIPQEMKEELKRELLEKISLELQKDFGSVPQNIVEDIAKKITDIMFKTFFEQRGANAEEATLKILERIQTLMEQKTK